MCLINRDCLFWAAGLALFTLGVWAQISLADYMLLSANRYPNAPIILLSTGAAVTTWGFLGCLGVAANLPSVLRAYGFFQLAALIAGLAGGLSGLFYREDIAGGFRSGLLRAVAGYTEDEGRADALDSLQRALECCGADGWRDWLASDWASQHMIFLPVENGTSRKGCLDVIRTQSMFPNFLMSSVFGPVGIGVVLSSYEQNRVCTVKIIVCLSGGSIVYFLLVCLSGGSIV
uniref:Uncharacterized protein n=1 Tax=Cynoglossus semilaevis TaxID=244447 RepID=A0A3P8VBB5_CYNSE